MEVTLKVNAELVANLQKIPEKMTEARISVSTVNCAANMADKVLVLFNFCNSTLDTDCTITFNDYETHIIAAWS